MVRTALLLAINPSFDIGLRGKNEAYKGRAALRGTRAAMDAIIADTDKTHTLQLVRTFPVEGANDDVLAKAIIRANQGLWTAAGPQNILRNVPADYSRGVELAAKAVRTVLGA